MATSRPLLISASGKLARTMQSSSPWLRGQERAGGLTNPAILHAQNQDYV